MRTALCLLIILVCLGVSSCPRPESGNAPANGRQGTSDSAKPEKLGYEVVGRINGSSTPNGAFKGLSAVAAQGENVVIADREFAAYNVFTADGALVAQIGCGFRVADYIPGDDELLATSDQTQEELPPDLANEIALNRFYRIEDIEIVGDRLFVLNSYFTSLVNEPALAPCIMELDMSGRFYKKYAIPQLVKSCKLGVSTAKILAFADALTNDVQITAGESKVLYSNKDIATTVKLYYGTLLRNKDNPAELTAFLAQHSNQGMRKEQYNGIGGIAMYTPVIDGKPDENSLKVIVCDSGNGRVKVLDQRGNILKVITGSDYGDSGFKSPLDVAVDSNGSMFITDGEKGAVFVVDKRFRLTGWFGEGELKNPVAVAVDDRGDVFVADRDAGEVIRFSKR